jgi:hypothetical protein
MNYINCITVDQPQIFCALLFASTTGIRVLTVPIQSAVSQASASHWDSLQDTMTMSSSLDADSEFACIRILSYACNYTLHQLYTMLVTGETMANCRNGI